MVKRFEVWKVADKTFDNCNSAGFKKLRIGAADNYAGVSERKIVEVTDKHTKYRKFRVSDVMEFVDLSGLRFEYERKVFIVFSLMADLSEFYWLCTRRRKLPGYRAGHLFKI